MPIQIKGDIIPNDYQMVYDWWGIEGTSPAAVNQALANANGQPVDVEINSGGGDVYSGSEIYTALRAYAPGVNIKIVGFAGSAASVIAMAGKSEISPTAQIMVHNASACSDGDDKDHAHISEVLANVNRSIAAAYVAKSGMTEQEALDMMEQETYLTAQQAVERKLVDKVMFAADEPEAVPQLAASSYGMIPRAAIAKMREKITSEKEKQAAVAMAAANYELLKLEERK